MKDISENICDIINKWDSSQFVVKHSPKNENILLENSDLAVFLLIGNAVQRSLALVTK
jgi:hypothetical protein